MTAKNDTKPVGWFVCQDPVYERGAAGHEGVEAVRMGETVHEQDQWIQALIMFFLNKPNK